MTNKMRNRIFGGGGNTCVKHIPAPLSLHQHLPAGLRA